MYQKRILGYFLTFLLSFTLFSSFPIKVIAQDTDLMIISSSKYVEDSGYVHVVGEILNANEGTAAYSGIKINYVFYDQDMQEVTRGSVDPFIDVLGPGEEAPFEVVIDDLDQSNAARTYKLTTEGTHVEPKPQALEVSVGDNHSEEEGYYYQEGMVTNTGDKIAHGVIVSAAFLDQNGTVMATGTARTDPEDIPPSGSGAFEILFIAPLLNGTRTTMIVAYSDEYGVKYEKVTPPKQSGPNGSSNEESEHVAANQTGSKPEQTAQQNQTSGNGQDNVTIDKSDLMGQKYNDSALGYELELPSGWTGAMVSNSILAKPNEVQDQSSGSALMALVILDKMRIGNLTKTLTSIGPVSNEGISQDSSCKIEEYAYRSINSKESLQIVAECLQGQQYAKIKGLAIMNDKKLFLLLFLADSQSLYEKYSPGFERAVSSLKVENAVGIKDAVAKSYNLKSESYQVTVKGKPVDLRIDTNSVISDLKFDEDAKRISIKVDGADDAAGYSLLTIDRIITGPYGVSIDGQPLSPIVEVEDEINGGKTLELSYNHDAHDIVITGTSVVPEFQIALLLPLGMIIAFLVRLCYIRRSANSLDTPSEEMLESFNT